MDFTCFTNLVGGFNAFETYYIVKFGNFPQVVMKQKNKHAWNHHLVIIYI